MLEALIECKRFLMKVPCVIFSGRTRMIVVDGASLQEVLGIPLAKISQKPLITIMD
jgi:hypothetical protein